MIKIAIHYESGLGRNDGNPLYVCAFLKRLQFFVDILFKRDQDKTTIKYFPSTESLTWCESKDLAHWWVDTFGEPFKIDHVSSSGKHDIQGEYDLNIWVDWGEDGLRNILPYEPVWPTHNVVYWASDTHLGYDYRLKRARQADVVFTAQKKATIMFKEDGMDSTWLPHAVEPLAYPNYNLASKKRDICFIGHINSENRIEMLDRALKEFPDFFYGQRKFEKASRIYKESRIVLNNSMKDDVNMRTFETMASGSFLMTDNIIYMDELFQDRKHCALYEDLDDMVEKIHYYLDNPKERERIAKVGYEEVMRRHTFKSRIKLMLEKSKHLILKEKAYA